MVKYISSGQSSSGILLNDDYAVLNVYGTADCTIVSRGHIQVFRGGLASNTTCYGHIDMSGGTAIKTGIYGSGWLAVSRYGYAISTNIRQGRMYVHGTATDTSISAGGQLIVSSGGTAVDTTINRQGSMFVDWGGTATNNIVAPSGYLYVSSKGTVNNVMVDSGGTMCVSRGGKITGFLQIETGAIVSAYSNSIIDLDISEKTTTSEALVNNLSLVQGSPNYTVTVSDNQATGTYILAKCISVLPESFSFRTTQENYDVITVNGTALVVADKKFSLATLDGNLILHVKPADAEDPINMDIIAPMLNSVPIASVENLSVTITWSAARDNIGVEGYQVKIGDNTYFVPGTSYSLSSLATGTYAYQVRAYDAAGNFSDWSESQSFQILPDTDAPIMKGEPSVHFDGRSATITWEEANDNVGVAGYQVKIGENIYSTIRTSYSLDISEPWALTCQIRAYDSANNYSDWSSPSNLILDGANATINSGTTANNTSVNGGILHISSGGTANGTLLRYNGGRLYVSSGGFANNTWILGDGPDENTVYPGGTMVVFSGGTASNTLIRPNGRLFISSGGKITGKLDISSDTNISAYSGSIIDFDISGSTTNNTALVNNLSLVRGTPNYTITVSASQNMGTYILAEGGTPTYFGTTVIGTKEKDYGTLSINQTLSYGDYNYTLTYLNSKMVLVVDENNNQKPSIISTTANITTPTNQNITVSAEFSENSSIKQYSLDNSTWRTYENAVVMTANGTIYFKATDAAGNVATAQYEVTNIDRIAPTKPTASADITTATNQNVVVTAVFSNDSAQKHYSHDGENWLAYTTGVVMSSNGSVYFRGIDAAGNISDVTSYAVSNIDQVAPTKPTASANITTPTNQDVSVTATFSGDSAQKQYSYDNSMWTNYSESGVVMSANGMVYFRGIDAAGNISEITSYAVTNIDKVAPAKPTAVANITTVTNQNVTVTATFSADSAQKQYSLDNRTWSAYTVGVVMGANGTVYFRGIDAAGNISDVTSYAVSNIDKVAPVITLVGDTQSAVYETSLAAMVDDGSKLYYRVGNSAWIEYTAPITVSTNAIYGFKATDEAGNIGTTSIEFSNILSKAPTNLVGSKDALSWGTTGASRYVVEYSTDNFAHTIKLTTTQTGLDSLDLPAGTYQWRVRSEDNDQWTQGESIISDNTSTVPKVISSTANGNGDVFFATANGTWTSGYAAKHVGSIGDWDGTNELVSTTGKNRLCNLFFGSMDSNILLLTDDANGDAIFVDDIYTELPGTVSQQQSRIARIQEIRAGVGDDIVDMTSQRFEYIGDGLTIRGGDGNDTLWANKGDNMLFGDAGNDRLVGASGNDVLAGGIGNDRMDGGGGSDIFAFCDNWGADIVEQLADGDITLWFESGSLDNWDASTLTYTDGTSSVKVSGVAEDKVSLKFGDDGSEQYASLAVQGAFADITTEKIYESKNFGFLATI